MATRITPEKIEEINELYLQLGVKAQVARQLGISPSTVSKYIIPDYKSKKEKENMVFDKEPQGVDELIKALKGSDNPAKYFAEICNVSEEEWERIRELQQEVLL